MAIDFDVGARQKIDAADDQIAVLIGQHVRYLRRRSRQRQRVQREGDKGQRHLVRRLFAPADSLGRIVRLEGIVRRIVKHATQIQARVGREKESRFGTDTSLAS